MTDTGQYDTTTSTGEWDRLVGSIDDEEAEEKFEAFWSGHRLSGDDPRWVETPATAPRSPAVGLPEPRRPEPEATTTVPRRGRSAAGRSPRLARAAMPPGRRRPTLAGARRPAPRPRRAGTGPARARGSRRRLPPQRRVRVGSRRSSSSSTSDNGGFMAAVLYAAAWYAVPVLAFGSG